MNFTFTFNVHPGEPVVFFRLLIATVVGGLVGWNRFRAGKPAGIGTHSLVALGSTIFVAVPLAMTFRVDNDSLTRVIQGVVAGIGFHGAGEIFRDPSVANRVKGLTSAAALWVTAALGVLAICGSGSLILVASIHVLGVLFIAPLLEHSTSPQNEEAENKGGPRPNDQNSIDT